MRLGLKGKILIGVMAVALVGGVGSAIALARTAASANGNPGAYDQAVYLYWGHETSTVEIANVENLSAGIAQYRGLTVSPKTTKSVSGNVRLTFTLEATAGEHHINGLTVSVYKINSAFDAENVVTQIGSTPASAELDKDHLTGTADLAVSTDPSDVHETVGYYAIKVLWSGANDLEHPAYTLDCGITISQSFVAA